MHRTIVFLGIIFCTAAVVFAQTDDLTMKIFKVQHGNAHSLYQMAEGMKSETGRVSFDANTGSIIVIDFPMNIARIASTIDMLDVAEKQVNIQVVVIEAESAALRSMGINSSRVIIPQMQFMAIGHFIKATKEVTVRTRMSVMTQSNQPALIQVSTDALIGDEIVQFEDGSEVMQPLRERVGKTLEVLPRVNPDGTITLIVRPSVSSLDRGALPSETAIMTRVSLKDGDTVALGALEAVNEEEKQDEFPGIPFFTKASAKNKRMVMFLTVDIVD